MKWLSFVLCCCLLLVGGTPTAAKPKEKAAPELAWVKGIADDFWDTMIQDADPQVDTLLSPECLKEQRSSHIQLLYQFVHGSLNNPTIRYTSEELAPDKSEVVFKGTVSEKDVVKADFTLRIAKESGGGKWSIRFIRFKERDSTPPPAAPAPAPARSRGTPPSQAGSGDGSGNPPARRADSAPRPSK